MGNQLTIKGAGLSQAQILALIAANAAAISHKSRHQDGGADEIDATGLTGKINYVDRGDPSAYDLTVANFGTIGSWTDINLSSIVPAGAIAIHYILHTRHPTVTNAVLSLRKAGNSNGYNTSHAYLGLLGQIISKEGFIACSSTRHIEYYNSNAGMDTADFVVKGWLLP